MANLAPKEPHDVSTTIDQSILAAGRVPHVSLHRAGQRSDASVLATVRAFAGDHRKSNCCARDGCFRQAMRLTSLRLRTCWPDDISCQFTLRHWHAPSTAKGQRQAQCSLHMLSASWLAQHRGSSVRHASSRGSRINCTNARKTNAP